MRLLRVMGLTGGALIGVVIAPAITNAADRISPPAQPSRGPGGADYRCARVVENRYGSGATQYWIFEPAAPAPTSASVVVFLHGWSAMYPRSYGYWIDHLAKRGHIVIYPRYQEALLTSPHEFTPNAVAALKAALTELQKGHHVRPETDHVAVVGHSMGGALTANIAALAGGEGLPPMRAVMSIAPGDGADRNRRIAFPKADWSKIPVTTLLLTVVGEDDALVGARYAKLIFHRTPQIPPGNKNYIVVRTDRHGSPALLANHMAPAASKLWARSVNALDYYGYWKLLDGLTEAAFFGTHREYALGNTPQLRFMGTWSDGTPVKELQVIDRP